MGYDRRREWTLLSIYQTYAQFFADRGRGIAVCKGFTDWKEHPPREWELEYDHLFRGTDGGQEDLALGFCLQGRAGAAG